MTLAALRPYQGLGGMLGAVRSSWASGVRRQLVSLPTGCHAAGQGVLLTSGEVVRVEDVQVGDFLLGPDSQPRMVFQLARGEGRMYRITPVKGDSFVVNEDHILTLVRTGDKGTPGGQLLDVSVRTWLSWTKSQRHVWKLFRSPAEFTPKADDLPLPAHFLGLWLGDGTSRSGVAAISKPDPEVLSECLALANGLGLRVRTEVASSGCPTHHFSGGGGRGQNTLIDRLRSLGVSGVRCEAKFVPFAYKTGSRETRLDVLAGLLDSDAHMTDGCYDFISKSRQLADDVAFLSRSLGMAAYVTPSEKSCQTGAGGTYFRVSISGDTSSIPCRIPRKVAPGRSQKKSVRRTGFSVDYVGRDAFYGFTLTGDGRYLMGDFTVTHNTGKTVCFANLPAIDFRRLLIVAHREELLDQAADKLRHWNPGLSVQVDQADRRADLEALSLFDRAEGYAVCASVATIGRKGSQRLTRYPADHFDAVVIDEAHHAAATSYRSVIEHFRAGEPGGPLLLGVTATPFRADGADLSKVFDRIVFSLDLPAAIERGYLVDIRAIAVQTHTELDGVSATREDFRAGELEDAVNTAGRNAKIVKAYLEKAAGRKAVAFCAGVQHSKDLTDALLSAGVPAEHIDGTTPGDLRAAILARLKSGETAVVCNVGVLTEGFDEPSLSCVILARPTKSGVLYAQMIGRGTRLFAGKSHLLVIDVADVSGHHTLVNAAALFGIPGGIDLEGQSVTAVRKKVKHLVQMEIPFEELAKAKRVADLDKIANEYRELKLWSPEPSSLVRGISRLPWVSADPHRVTLRAGQIRASVSIDLLGKARLLVIRRGERRELVTEPDEVLTSTELASLPEAVVAADQIVQKEAPRVFVDPKASWRKSPASEKQLEILRRRRVPFPPGITKGEASILLDKVFARAGGRA